MLGHEVGRFSHGSISSHRQGPVVELLTQWKAIIDPDQAAGSLCDAASRCVNISASTYNT